MFGDLIKRQLVEDILSFRFLMSVVIILSTVILFSLVFIANYHNLLDAYSKSRISNENTLMSFCKAPSSNLDFVSLYCLMKPKPEMFISEGLEGKMPPGFLFSTRPYFIQDAKQEKEVLYTHISHRDLSSSAFSASPDMTFIVQFLLSFFAVVLTFNAVSSEKERGTLRLVYSNSLKSAYFILAKYIAAFLILSLPLLLGLILGLILLFSISASSFSSSLTLSFLLFWIISLVYLSVFILVGLLCSTISHSSKTSLVLCLLSWIFLVVIIPKSTGALLSLKEFDVPTEEEIHELANSAEKATMGIFNKQLSGNYMRGLDEDHKREAKLRANYEIDKSRQDVFDYYLRKKLSAIKTVRAINSVLPASAFEFSASCISGTGLFHFENLWIQTKRYGNDFISFLKDNASILKKDAYFYPDSDSVSNKPIDANAIPRFEDKNIKPGEKIRGALPYIAILIMCNLLLFILVFYRFQRYDIR